MQKINPVKLGLALGGVVGLWHLCWAVLVAVGWAQPVLDFLLWMHFIEPAFHVGPFAATTAFVLVAVTGAVGFVGGLFLAAAWNWLNRADVRS